MPVIDGVFVPRTPLTDAERHVDFTAHDHHIVSRRLQIEEAALPAARRVAVLASEYIQTRVAERALEAQLERQLDLTARFGYTAVTAELARLRAGRAATAGLVIDDAGRYGQVARQGLAGVTLLVKQRAAAAARAVASAALHAALDSRLTDGDPLARAVVAARKTLHLHVLELVGETLNLGRASAALSNPQIPEFALRSEQLDRNTCAPCDGLHGTVVQVGTPEFFAILPPTDCLGGGRCRGVMVFGDGPRDVRVPELLAA